MKYFSLLILILLTFNINAQKYLELVPIEAPDSAGCGGRIKAIFHGGVMPLENTFEYYTTQTSGGGRIVENLCDNIHNTISFIDSTCSDLESGLRLHADTSEQITLDTIIISMPSGIGICDAQVEFRFRNVLPTDNPSYGTGVVNGGITSYFLNNFCGNVWNFSIYRGGYEEIKVSIDIRINPPSPCIHFDEGLNVNSPSTSTFCNGQIISTPSVTFGQPYSYSFISSGGLLMNANPYQTQVNNICQGPYLIDVHNDDTYMWKRSIIFVFADDAPDYLVWNEPDSILPFTDTIQLQALANCSADYDIAIDTAFISSIIGTGADHYDFGISLVQGVDTIITFGSAIVDTSTNFFVGMTIYCGDSVRSDSYSGSCNLIYHGLKLPSTASILENDLIFHIEIFPNPFEDRITLNYFLKESTVLKFEISDITGKIIQSVNYSSSIGKNHLSLDLDQFASGLYLLNIRNEKGLLQSKKLIKN